MGEREPSGAIFLVGYMGSGKTSVGRVLGRRLGWRFEDLDERIERETGRSIAQIFRESGENGFRQAEQAALRRALQEFRDAPVVMALGGGTFVQAENSAMINARGTSIFLHAPIEELWRRCQGGEERPLQRGEQHFRHLYETRLPEYMKASVRVDTSGKDVESVATEIIQVLRLAERNSIAGEK